MLICVPFSVVASTYLLMSKTSFFFVVDDVQKANIIIIHSWPFIEMPHTAFNDTVLHSISLCVQKLGKNPYAINKRANKQIKRFRPWNVSCDTSIVRPYNQFTRTHTSKVQSRVNVWNAAFFRAYSFQISFNSVAVSVSLSLSHSWSLFNESSAQIYDYFILAPSQSVDSIEMAWQTVGRNFRLIFLLFLSFSLIHLSRLPLPFIRYLFI